MGMNMAENAKKELDEFFAFAKIKSPAEMKASAEHSVRGFLSVLLDEKAFRTDFLTFVCCSGIALAIPSLSACERALMIYSVFMPLVAELVNTAIEKTIDRISTDFHWLSGLAKDIGSSLVLVSFVGAGIVWAVILVAWAMRYFGI